MIIVNGTLETATQADGGIDASTGLPTEGTVTYGAAVPCQYYPTAMDRLRRSVGEPVTAQSYAVLIEGDGYGGDRVRLKDAAGSTVGVFSVRAVTVLKAVGQVRIDI